MTWQVQCVKDSFDFIAKLKDQCVDVTITDPPYSQHVHENMTSGTAMKKHVLASQAAARGEGPRERKGIPRILLPFGNLQSYDFAQDLPRISKRWALAFCAFEDFGSYRDAVGQKQYMRSACWIKPNSQGQMTGDRPAAAYEGIAVMHREVKKQWNGRGSFGCYFPEDDDALYVWNGTRGEKGRHPNQKPLNLCLELVAKFSNAGETVFDPFAGSGRIGEACVLLGRNYLGLDNSQEWVEKARERLRAADAASPMRDEDCLRLCAVPKRTKP